MGRHEIVEELPYLAFKPSVGNYLRYYCNGSITPDLEYSWDGETWDIFPAQGVYVSQDQEIFVRGNNPNGISNGTTEYMQFIFDSANASVECRGSISGLINAGNKAAPVTAVPNRYCFYHLFENATWLVSAPKLDIPVLASYCYQEIYVGCTRLAAPSDMTAIREAPAYCCYRMYSGCTALTVAKIPLKATVLGNACYSGMYLNCTGLTTVEAFPSTIGENCFSGTFEGCTSLSVVPDLPATALVEGCYRSMFLGCTALTKAPALPATTLAPSCYSGMFNACSNLVTPPALPAENMKGYCYQRMFQDCSSLVTPPALPATTLAASCYYQMFNRCTSLETAPALPATTLANSCYYQMFSGCRALVTAPDLPALALVSNCYYMMFRSCTHLNFIRAMFTTSPTSSYTGRWVDGVASTGTFVKNSAATWTTTGVNGVPTEWTILYETP